MILNCRKTGVHGYGNKRVEESGGPREKYTSQELRKIVGRDSEPKRRSGPWTGHKLLACHISCTAESCSTQETPHRVHLWWELVAAQVPEGRRNLGEECCDPWGLVSHHAMLFLCSLLILFRQPRLVSAVL